VSGTGPNDQQTVTVSAMGHFENKDCETVAGGINPLMPRRKEPHRDLMLQHKGHFGKTGRKNFKSGGGDHRSSITKCRLREPVTGDPWFNSPKLKENLKMVRGGVG